VDQPQQSSEWLSLSFGVAAGLSLNTLLIAKLRESEIRPDVLAFYWFLIVAGGLGVAILLRGQSLLPPATFLPPQQWWPLLTLGAACLAGTLANICFFSAVFSAPHPGYVTAIRASEAAIVALAAVFLGRLYAKSNSLGLIQFGGIALIVIGVVLLSLRKW